MSRKPLFAADVDLPQEELRPARPGEAKPQSAFHMIPAPTPTPVHTISAPTPIPVHTIASAASTQVPVPARAGIKDRTVASTLYLLPRDHLRLRAIAGAQNVSVQTLILDAIDLLLEREGEPPVGRWETRRRKRERIE